jgi:hypothetical protein
MEQVRSGSGCLAIAWLKSEDVLDVALPRRLTEDRYPKSLRVARKAALPARCTTIASSIVYFLLVAFWLL